jgi:hypothetical protein
MRKATAMAATIVVDTPIAVSSPCAVGTLNYVAVEQREIFSIADLDAEYFTKLVNVNVVGTSIVLRNRRRL